MWVRGVKSKAAVRAVLSGVHPLILVRLGVGC